VPSDGAETAAEDVAAAGAPDAASGEDGEQAAMINAQADYCLITSGVNGGDEALFIVDKASQKMVIYQIRGTELVPLAGTNFR